MTTLCNRLLSIVENFELDSWAELSQSLSLSEFLYCFDEDNQEPVDKLLGTNLVHYEMKSFELPVSHNPMSIFYRDEHWMKIELKCYQELYVEDIVPNHWPSPESILEFNMEEGQVGESVDIYPGKGIGLSIEACTGKILAIDFFQPTTTNNYLVFMKEEATNGADSDLEMQEIE
ncbi:hypothetical protein COR50_09135 [Chitinophaga caeni]|uniref:Uncharacterized protein n=1 Tax=Chitinophaga caeni TaxID=2029983 RepID=A0A291QTW4_9BACT|nr:hypothetical protein [Chitinophaga caeni]ATL47322.1 hypothetical protein COR50_09135 [Chitinophaga caeni]